MLSRLAACLDTVGFSARARAARDGEPARSRPDIAFFDTRRAQYRYRASGAGPAIVFCADPPLTIEAYDDLIARLSSRFRVIVFEAPAMGFSPARLRYGFSFRETADDIALFLRAVAGPGAVLAFSCASGLAAVDIAARHPDLVSRLALVQTTDWQGFQDWKAKRDPKRILAKPFLGQMAMARMAAARMPQWFDLATGARAMIPAFCACAGAAMEGGAQWSLASAYQRFLKSDASPLGRPRQPMLVIWGEADRSHGAEARERARTLGASVEIVSHADLGHFSDLEDPARFVAVLSRFLGAGAPAY